MLKKSIVISTIFILSACISSGENKALESSLKPEIKPVLQQSANIKQIAIPQEKPKITSIAFASEPITLNPLAEEEVLPPPPPPPRIKKTYLINGLASNVDSIGYGFTNLSKKIPNSQLHNYASFVESSTVIRTKVSKEIKAAYAANPDIEINLIGISFGANIVTWIAQELARKKIPINYLATLEGPAMAPIYDNVRFADNFSCTRAGCFRTSSKLAWKNKKTDFSKFKIKSSHIALADHPKVHQRVISQINKPLNPSNTNQLTAQ